MKKIAIMLATIIFIQLGATSVFADYTDVRNGSIPQLIRLER